MTSKEKTKELMKQLEKSKLKRARTKKGRFVADDPSTPENEAFVKSGVPINHIKEATNKAQKSKQDFFLLSWLRKLFGVEK